ncbi:MAG TPA: hypothetical protein VFT19_10175, partial [Solirubrobacterales bacterium]|nr:hypothetical protein [Solirubrobacterales bacterium]
PQVTIDSLSKALLKAGESSELTWHADENGAFQLRAGGADCDTGDAIASGAYGDQPATQAIEIAAADLAEGESTLRLCLTDAAGNRDAATRTIERDTTTPDTQIDQQPAALDNEATATFAFSGSDSGGSGVASFQCKLDSGSFEPCNSGIELIGLGEGSHKFEVRAIDNAGNVDGSPALHEWTVDTTSPTTQITREPPSLADVDTAVFEFSGSDGAGPPAFQCRLDSASSDDWASCDSPKAYTGLSQGAHKFEVRAIDQAGNADPTPATSSWAIDTTAPDEPASPSSPSPAPEPGSKPDSEPEAAEFLRVHRNLRAGTALLVFRVPGAGVLSARPPQITLARKPARSRTVKDTRRLRRLLQRRIKPRNIRVGRPGQVKVPIELTKAGKKLLRRNHRLKVRVVVSYRSNAGSKATWKFGVLLRKQNIRQLAEKRRNKRHQTAK